ncbi:MAG: hypothetical protein Q8L47_00485 [bacterium]|nr:hypothetical protein [bacterium]
MTEYKLILVRAKDSERKLPLGCRPLLFTREQGHLDDYLQSELIDAVNRYADKLKNPPTKVTLDITVE